MSRFGGSLPNNIKVPLPTDGKGMTGRECPDKRCLGYFKVKFGTGLKGAGLPCFCPYCGHTGPHSTFFTPEQLEYAKSVAIREFSQALTEKMRKMEFDIKPTGAFGIGVSMKVNPGPLNPIRRYREKLLETDVICSQCTLHYSIYGVFGFCPDCGIHNSLQILKKNLELAGKELDLALQQQSKELQDHLLGDALENVVSAFDGFGRQMISLAAPQEGDWSFQNINAADAKVTRRFGTGLSAGVSTDQWRLVARCFQKRHLLAHKMGVIDKKYLAAGNDPAARIGRKARIDEPEVRSLITAIELLGGHLATLVSRQLRTRRAEILRIDTRTGAQRELQSRKRPHASSG